MSSTFDWATHSGDAWTRNWRAIDAALADLAPKLHHALLDFVPAEPFNALDVGCGAGSTSEQLALERSDATIIGCDLSPSLVRLAQDRLADLETVHFLLGDAPIVARSEGPFDLLFSRHGVMFFDDPIVVFRRLRVATNPGGTLVFSCFQDWRANPWASELASAAADQELPPPGREAGGFAFADPDHVRQILGSAGWNNAELRPAPFRYIAGVDQGAVEQALNFLSDVGPASRVLSALPDSDRPAAVERMRHVLESHRVGETIEFPAAAWLWSAQVPTR